MCERALQIKDAFIALTAEEMDLENEALTATDWSYLADLTDFLAPFRTATKINESLFDTIDKIFSTLEFLLGHLEEMKKKYRENQWISVRIDSA